MRTTVELPDDLFRQAKARAALAGTTLKALIAESLARTLGQTVPSDPPRRRRSRLPVVRGARARLPLRTNAQLFQLLEAEEDERHGGGRRRSP